jgi:predicted kinase
MVKMIDLIIILGSPASGKTTLARRLGVELAAPCLCKDDIKEALFDILGVADRGQSRRLSDASFAAQLRLAQTQLEAGLSCIVEGNWRPEHAVGVLAITADTGVRVAQVWCRASPLEIARRFASRTRHPGHLDAVIPSDEIKQFSEMPPSFLELAGPHWIHPRWIYDSGDTQSYERLNGDLKIWRAAPR